jgi:hypothetical protein
MGHIFISYSHQDADYAQKLAKRLQEKGFDVWIDARLDYGSQWPREIQKQLDSCAGFILIMSPRAFASEWVQSELSRAKRKQKPIFPLLLEGDEPWLTVESTQFSDVRGGKFPPENFYPCLEAVLAGPETAGTPAPQAAPQPRKARQIVGIFSIFLIGVVLLGIGFWAYPKFFSRQPASQATKEPAGIDPPRIATAKDARQILIKGAPDLERKAYQHNDAADMFRPGTDEVFASLKSSDQVIWSYIWCAASAKTLESNLKAIKVQFILDGSQVSGLYVVQLDFSVEDLYCHTSYTALYDWPEGIHHLTIKSVLTTVVNDGADDYQPGEYLTNYTVTVKP